MQQKDVKMDVNSGSDANSDVNMKVNIDCHVYFLLPPPPCLALSVKNRQFPEKPRKSVTNALEICVMPESPAPCRFLPFLRFFSSLVSKTRYSSVKCLLSCLLSNVDIKGERK